MSEVPSEQESNRNPDGTFKPGASGNPGGRPKGRTIMQVLISRMEEIPIGQTKAYVEQIAEMLLEAMVVKKDVSAAKLAMEYTEIKPKQTLELDVNKENVDAMTEVLKLLSSSPKNGTTDTKPAENSATPDGSPAVA